MLRRQAGRNPMDAAFGEGSGDRPLAYPPAQFPEPALSGWAGELFRLLVNTFEDSAISLLDRYGRITSWNQGGVKVTGFQAEEVLGKHLSVLYPAEDSAGAKPERDLQLTLEQGRFEQEGWRVRKGGARFWARAIITALRDDAGNLCAFAVVTCDRTEQERTKKELQKSEQRLDAIFHSLQIGALLAGPSEELLMCNQAARDLLALTDDAAGRPLFNPRRKILYPDGSPCPPQARPIQRAIAHKIPVRGQMLGFQNPGDPKVRWFSVAAEPQLAADGSVSQVLCTFVDMTEPKLAADLVLERENRYEAAVQASGQILYDWNLETGEVTFGGNVRKTLGFDLEEIGGRLEGWIDLLHPLDRPAFQEEFECVRATGKAFHLLCRMRRKDGVYITVQNNGFFFPDNGRRRSSLIGFVSDISDRLQLEDRLRQSQRLEGIGQHTGGIAHDFNNVLMAIQGHSAVLCDGIGRTNPLRRTVEEIEKAVGLASALTRQLLASGKGETIEPSTLDLNRIARRMEPMLRCLMGQGIELRLVLGSGALIRAVRGQAEQAILNLAVNARDAMPAGGALTIETALGRAKTGRGAYVMLSVTDTGSGMNADTRGQAFDPFFTTKDNGTGLGLSTVYTIVKENGGFVRLRTEPERGSVFETYWPKADEGAKLSGRSRPPKTTCLSKDRRPRARKSPV